MPWTASYAFLITLTLCIGYSLLVIGSPIPRHGHGNGGSGSAGAGDKNCGNPGSAAAQAPAASNFLGVLVEEGPVPGRVGSRADGLKWYSYNSQNGGVAPVKDAQEAEDNGSFLNDLRDTGQKAFGEAFNGIKHIVQLKIF